MKQDQVAENVVAVPGMVRLAAFVLAVLILRAQQAVVLDVVGAGQLPPGKQGVQQQERQHDPAEGPHETEPDRRRQRVGLQDLVVRMPRGPAAAGQPVLLDIPGAQERAREFAGRKLVDALTHARTGHILGRRYVAVVAAIVVDGEMAVSRNREHDLRQ